jgi:pimeloyl-ACP methyl ester carboxylesterase
VRGAARAFAALLALVGLTLGGLAAHDRAAPAPGAWLAAAGLEARFASVGGQRLRYVRTGSGPAVVLVHGFGSSLYTWKDVIPGLAPDHDTIALDLPGFGMSDRPSNLRLDDLPGAVSGLMDLLQVRRAALVGNSMGGAAAALVAARSPGRVAALVLVDAAGFNLGPGERPGLVRLAMSPVGQVVSRLPGQRLLVELALRQVFRDPSLVTRERVAEYLAGVRQPGAFAALRSLGDSLGDRSGIVREALPHVSAPTLVVWGRADAWIPLEQAGRFTASIAGSRLAIIEDSGHVPQEERPRELLRLLREFLAASGA